MEVNEAITMMNNFLNQSVLFRSFKFILGFYLVIIGVTIVLLLYRMVKKAYWTTFVTGQGFPTINRWQFQPHWKKVLERISSDNPNEWKIAIIEAASMLDEVLRTIKYPGSTLGERLANIQPSQLENINEVKEAHKIRNHIIKNHSFQPSKEEAQMTINAFEKALRFFEAIG